MSEQETITAFKGFNSDWTCRGFQYKLGETFHHEEEVELCKAGFHACEYPLDVFSYYPPAGNRFAVVRQSGALSRNGSDSKVASQSITVLAEIDVAGLVAAALEYTLKRCSPVNPASSTTGDQGAASATGYQGAASATGDQGAASATGYQGAASATGKLGAASATGRQGAASATGVASVASATGWRGQAQAAESCALVLVYRDDDGNIVHIRASKVGENGIKPGVWYVLSPLGEFEEVKNEVLV